MVAARWTAGVLVTVGVAVSWLCFNAPPGELTGDARKLTAQGDLIAYYLPMAEVVAARLGAFEMPLWNPHACSGIPLLATLQSGVLYPGTWLALVLPAHEALSWRMLLECWLAGILSTWMFLAWGRSATASATGGVLYVFACVLGQILWPPAASTLTLVPGLLLCAEKLLRERFSRGWWCALAAVVALQLLAGFPQYVVYGFFVAVPVVALRAAEAGVSSHRLLTIAGAVAVGVGLAGIQMVPTFELAQGSLRAAAVPSATDLHYLTIWNPHTATDVLANAVDPSPSLVAFHLGNSGGYLGTATLLLAALALILDRRKTTWMWACLAAVSLALSNGMLGATEPVYRLFAEIPLVGSFRTPERLRFVTFFAVIALAVGGFDALRRADPRRLRIAAGVVSAGLLAAMLALGAGAASWRVVAALALVLAVGWTGLGDAKRRAAELLLFVFIVLDLALATAPLGPLREIPVDLSNRFRTADRRAALPEGLFEKHRDALGTARIAVPGYRPRIATAPSDGGYRVACYEPLVPSSWPALETTLRGKHAMGATLFDLDPVEHATFYDVAGVRRFLGSGVLENPDALPRAYVTASYRVVTQEEAFVHLREGDVDFRQTVLLEQAPGFEAASETPISPAEITAYAPEQVAIEAKASGPALLVLSDSHYPGWRAMVDGEPAEILRANGLYRAVVLSEGSNEVVFEYVPGSVRLGGVVSLVSLGVLAVVWLTRRRGD